MARTDVIVLGAGIVGTSAALHLSKRGVAVALVDRRGPGEETSYGNTGIIEGNTLFPHAFPSGFGKLLQIALLRAPEANYHLSALPKFAPWLLAYRANTRGEGSVAFAEAMRPLYARALGEHEALMVEAGATRYLRRDGWIKLYRSEDAFAATAREREYAGQLGLNHRVLDAEAARALEPSLMPVFRHAVHWPDAASVSNPLAVTKAYAAAFGKHGGVIVKGDARTLHRAGADWRVDTDEGPIDAKEAVVALGPWAPDLLGPLGIRLPLAFKRGYHRHFHALGNAGLTRPVVDTEYGYCLAPMEQGIRLTTGAEFAERDAPPTPHQFARLLPAARKLFPLGEGIEAQPWVGSRPCFADSRPVIGRAPGQPGLWLDYGHAHWGLTLGPVSGRLIAEIMTGATPFCDPKPYGAERFAH
jgi:D-amino-acid dehydrogenase